MSKLSIDIVFHDYFITSDACAAGQLINIKINKQKNENFKSILKKSDNLINFHSSAKY